MKRVHDVLAWLSTLLVAAIERIVLWAALGFGLALGLKLAKALNPLLERLFQPCH